MTRVHTLACVLLLAACTTSRDARETSASSVATEKYPAQEVRLIEPFGAGGGPDVIARALGVKLSELWGRPVVVENHPGGGSTAGPALVAKAPPDGYTLLVNTSAHAYSAAIVKDLPYDPLSDFIPVAALTTQPYVLVTGRQSGIETLSALIAAAKAAPGRLRFASTGRGTGTHLGIEKLNLAIGVQASHIVPDPGEAIADVIAGTVAGRADYQLVPIPLAVADIRAGKLVALGVTGIRRSELLPQVPTIAEAGVAGFDFPIWYGVWAPRGTPNELIERLARDIARALASPDLRNSLAQHGAEPMNMTQVDFARFVLRESESAAQVMKAK